MTTVVSLYRKLGGRPVVERLVSHFYRQMERMEEAAIIRAMHPADLGATERLLVLYLSQWLGGPQDYTARRGHPRLRQRHLGFAIGAGERDAWLLCMGAALDAVIADPQDRAAIYRDLAKLADWMRNQPGNAHDRPVRLQTVPPKPDQQKKM